jgi:tripartite-type tricarboxylate transporter receptor subunit TctC
MRGLIYLQQLFLGLVFVCGTAAAQSWPTKPVKLIVTYPPGGSSDLMSRVYGAKLAELWGQQVVIESKPGAAGSIGMDFAAKQPNDGYTFVVGNLGPVAVNPLLSKVPYNIEKDFIAVSMISTGPNVLVVRTDSEFKSLGDIIAFAKKNPGKLNYGTSGPGSVSHLSSEMLKNAQKINAVEVAYKGGVLAIQDLLGGQIQYIFSDSLPAMAHIKAGKLRALCVTGSSRYELLPEPPLCQDAAPGLVAVNWWGVLLPAGSPKTVVDKLNADTVKALADPDVKKRFADLGVEATSSSPQTFANFIRAEMAKYAALIREANIKVNQ